MVYLDSLQLMEKRFRAVEKKTQFPTGKKSIDNFSVLICEKN